MNLEPHRLIIGTRLWLRWAAHSVRYDYTGKLLDEIACDSYEMIDAYRELLALCQTGTTLATGQTAASASYARAFPSSRRSDAARRARFLRRPRPYPRLGAAVVLWCRTSEGGGEWESNTAPVAALEEALIPHASPRGFRP